jgi:hypothetical protein
MSPQCQQLNRLFSQCVDGNPIRVPQNLEDPPEPSPSSPPFILDVLHKASTTFIENTKISTPDASDLHDLEIMDLFLSRDKLAVSEFELLQMVLHWCDRNLVDIMSFSHFFDFSALSDEQQIWFLGRLPTTAAAPGIVRNGLLQSDLVTSDELRRFGLDHHRLHWKPVYKSSTDRMGRFLSTMCRSLELFHKKLIILQVDQRLSLAIYVPQKIQKASEVQVDTNVRVFALPHSQGSTSPDYRVLPTKKDYRLYCDEGVFQLYQLKRANTWIYLAKSQMNDESYRNEQNPGDRRRKKQQTIEAETNFDCRASVALDKIGRGIQKHVGKVNRAGILSAVSHTCGQHVTTRSSIFSSPHETNMLLGNLCYQQSRRPVNVIS